jgi:hypothetical protein
MKRDISSILTLIEKIVQTAKIVLEEIEPKKKLKKGDNANVKRTGMVNRIT